MYFLYALLRLKRQETGIWLWKCIQICLSGKRSRRKKIFIRSSWNCRERKGLKDQALEICRKGAEELKDSKQLRILYMRMQCSDSDISREICAQTVKEYLNQIPEIKEETEFQKLAQEYGIVMEGENVWVGR